MVYGGGATTALAALSEYGFELDRRGLEQNEARAAEDLARQNKQHRVQMERYLDLYERTAADQNNVTYRDRVNGRVVERRGTHGLASLIMLSQLAERNSANASRLGDLELELDKLKEERGLNATRGAKVRPVTRAGGAVLLMGLAWKATQFVGDSTGETLTQMESATGSTQ